MKLILNTIKFFIEKMIKCLSGRVFIVELKVNFLHSSSFFLRGGLESQLEVQTLQPGFLGQNFDLSTGNSVILKQVTHTFCVSIYLSYENNNSK